jgi:hypothetical protein
VRNDAARGSLLLALVGIAIPPAGFAAARQLERVSLVQATAATCASAVLGLAAIMLAGGHAAARAGRLLGLISLCLGLTAAFALGFYGLLNLFG